MANFIKRYNPDRSADWNYGGSKWRLSRSKIELFTECPRCFYIDNKLGTSRPRGPAFTINIAVDKLLKKEFDSHRHARTQHPLMKKYRVDALPFSHPKIDHWRDNFKGIEYKDPATGMYISGAIDDAYLRIESSICCRPINPLSHRRPPREFKPADSPARISRSWPRRSRF